MPLEFSLRKLHLTQQCANEDTDEDIELERSDPSDECYYFKRADMAQVSLPVMEDLRREGKLVDVHIRVGDSCLIHAHKLVLAATVPYFNGMFTNDLIEATQDEVHIREEFDGPAFESVIDYAYSGSIKLTASNVQSVLIVASFLGLDAVVDACSAFLHPRLQANNVLGIRSFAQTHNMSRLVSSANKFIDQHFESVVKSDEFSQLTCEEVANIISRNELNITSEESVYTALMDWIKGHECEREQYLPQLLAFVRLPLLSPQFLADSVASEHLIKSSHPCRDLLDEAKDYHLMPERRTLLLSFRTRPRFRCPTDSGVIYAVGGLTKSGDSLSTVEMLNPKSGRWEMAEAMSMLRSRVGVTVMNMKLYAIGGYNGSERLSTVEAFDPQMRRWSKVAPMNCKRSAVGAATLQNRLYVCGGYDGISSLNTVESYDADRNEWLMMPVMSKSRSAAGLVSFEGFLVALGGHDGMSIFDSVERFDPSTRAWTLMPSMRTKRCRLGVAVLNYKLYVCGGYDGATFLQSAEVYDPKTKTWSFIAPMNVTRSRVALVANCGKLYAIGGYDGVSNLSSVEVYDPETDTWTFAESMCAHEGGVGVGVVPN